MQTEGAIDQMNDILNQMSISTTNTKKVLGIMYMHCTDGIFSETDHDVVMKRETKRFYDIFMRYLEQEDVASPSADVERILRFFEAWRRLDVHMLQQMFTCEVPSNMSE